LMLSTSSLQAVVVAGASLAGTSKAALAEAGRVVSWKALSSGLTAPC
jgi:hypothetical protein